MGAQQADGCPGRGSPKPAAPTARLILRAIDVCKDQISAACHRPAYFLSLPPPPRLFWTAPLLEIILYSVDSIQCTVDY